VVSPAVTGGCASDRSKASHAANLPDVTSADVNALIPVASESLSSAVPGTGPDLLGGDAGGNVGISGAATAAFDAFDDHSSVPVIDDGHAFAANVIEQPDDSLHAGLDALQDADIPTVATFDDPSAQLTDGIIDDAPLVGDAGDTDWQ